MPRPHITVGPHYLHFRPQSQNSLTIQANFRNPRQLANYPNIETLQEIRGQDVDVRACRKCSPMSYLLHDDHNDAESRIETDNEVFYRLLLTARDTCLVVSPAQSQSNFSMARRLSLSEPKPSTFLANSSVLSVRPRHSDTQRR